MIVPKYAAVYFAFNLRDENVPAKRADFFLSGSMLNIFGIALLSFLSDFIRIFIRFLCPTFHPFLSGTQGMYYISFIYFFTFSSYEKVLVLFEK